MRQSQKTRTTAETDIRLTLNLDGSGRAEISSGCGFLNHMLTLFAKHGRFDLSVFCHGDVEVDDHHTVEDVGIVLGEAFCEALGEKRGIRRYGDIILPMDESLVLAALDLSGRSHLSYAMKIPARKVGSFDTELAEEFWQAFVRASGCTLHIRQMAGGNSHHLLEASFKAVARALRTAVSVDPSLMGEIPSSKGVL